MEQGLDEGKGEIPPRLRTNKVLILHYQGQSSGDQGRTKELNEVSCVPSTKFDAHPSCLRIMWHQCKVYKYKSRRSPRQCKDNF